MGGSKKQKRQVVKKRRRHKKRESAFLEEPIETAKKGKHGSCKSSFRSRNGTRNRGKVVTDLQGGLLRKHLALLEKILTGPN